MKSFIQESASSIIRWLLVVYGSFLATISGAEVLSGDPSLLSFTELITGTVLALLAFALKKVDGFGSGGAIVKSLIGPRVLNISHSIARWIVGLASGAVAAYLSSQGAELSADQVGQEPVAGIVVILAGFAFDRLSKLLRP